MVSRLFGAVLTAIEWFCNIFMRLVGLFLLLGGMFFLAIENEHPIMSEMGVRAGLPWYWGILTIIAIIWTGMLLLTWPPRRRTFQL